MKILKGFFSITINEKGWDDVLLVLFICNLNLNSSCNGVDVESKDSDNKVLLEEFKNEGFKSDGSRNKSSTLGIGKLLNVIEGIVGKEFVVEESIESAVDDSCSLLF